MAEESRTFLNDHHKIMIAKMIRDNKTIIKGVGKGLSIKQRKNRVWQEIFDKVIENGGVIPSVTHLRKVSDKYSQVLHRRVFLHLKMYAFGHP